MNDGIAYEHKIRLLYASFPADAGQYYLLLFMSVILLCLDLEKLAAGLYYNPTLPRVHRVEVFYSYPILIFVKCSYYFLLCKHSLFKNITRLNFVCD